MHVLTTGKLLFFPLKNFKYLYDLKIIKIPMERNPVRRESATQFSPIHFPCRSGPSSSVSPPPSSSLYWRVSGGRQDGQMGGRRTGCRPPPERYKKNITVYCVDRLCMLIKEKRRKILQCRYSVHVDQRESYNNIGRVFFLLSI
jgi:hypothetical protein